MINLSPMSFSGKKIDYNNLPEELRNFVNKQWFNDCIEELGVSYFEITANKGRFILPFCDYDLHESNLYSDFSGLKIVEQYQFSGGLGYSVYEIEQGVQYGLILIGNVEEGYCLYKILPNLGEKVKTMLEL